MRLQLSVALATLLSMDGLGMGAPVPPARPPITDIDFLLDALACGTAEVKYSELAERQAQAKEIQEFAGKVIDQQGSDNRKVIILARDNKLPWDLAQQRGQAEALASGLENRQGVAFDEDYLKNTIRSIEQLIEVSERCSGGPGSSAVREQADRMLPTLRERRKEAQHLLKKESK